MKTINLLFDYSVLVYVIISIYGFFVDTPVTEDYLPVEGIQSYLDFNHVYIFSLAVVCLLTIIKFSTMIMMKILPKTNHDKTKNKENA